MFDLEKKDKIRTKLFCLKQYIENAIDEGFSVKIKIDIFVKIVEAMELVGSIVEASRSLDVVLNSIDKVHEDVRKIFCNSVAQSDLNFQTVFDKRKLRSALLKKIPTAEST